VILAIVLQYRGELASADIERLQAGYARESIAR